MSSSVRVAPQRMSDTDSTACPCLTIRTAEIRSNYLMGSCKWTKRQRKQRHKEVAAFNRMPCCHMHVIFGTLVIAFFCLLSAFSVFSQGDCLCLYVPTLEGTGNGGMICAFEYEVAKSRLKYVMTRTKRKHTKSDAVP